jgi:DNA-binding Lrp family transcriptional regulator
MVEKNQKLQLLEELYKNSRIRANNLGSKINLSRQTISKIRNNYWKNEVIHSATILFNPYVLNLQYFFMEIKTNPAEPELLKYLKTINEVISVDGIIGDYALIVKLEVRTKKEFAQILDKIDSEMTETYFQSYRIIDIIDVFKLGGVIIETENAEVKIQDEKKWKLLNLLKKNNNIKKWPERRENEFFTKEELNYLDSINISREYDRFISEHAIKCSTITLKPTMADFKMKFIMRIKPQKIGLYNLVANQMKKEPNIIELFRTGEDFGLLAIIRTKNLDDFKEFIYSMYEKYEIIDTHTTVVVDEHIPTMYPPTLNVAKELCGIEIDDTGDMEEEF